MNIIIQLVASNLNKLATIHTQLRARKETTKLILAIKYEQLLTKIGNWEYYLINSISWTTLKADQGMKDFL